MFLLTTFILVAYITLAVQTLATHWNRISTTFQPFIVIILIIVLPWLSAGTAISFIKCWDSICSPQAVDWDATGTMLTALVGIPGVAIAITVGVIEYLRWSEDRELRDKSRTPDALKALAAALEEKLVGAEEDLKPPS